MGDSSLCPSPPENTEAFLCSAPVVGGHVSRKLHWLPGHIHDCLEPSAYGTCRTAFLALSTQKWKKAMNFLENSPILWMHPLPLGTYRKPRVFTSTLCLKFPHFSVPKIFPFTLRIIPRLRICTVRQPNWDLWKRLIEAKSNFTASLSLFKNWLLTITSSIEWLVCHS